MRTRSQSPRLILDNVTYPFLQNSYKAMLITYLLYGYVSIMPDGKRSYAEQESFVSKVKSIGSAGIVTRCISYPWGFSAADAKKSGPICCMRF